MKIGEVILKKGRERSILQGHPWIFSGAIESERLEAPDPAELKGEQRSVDPGRVGAIPVRLRSAGGAILGRGLYNPHSSIRVRLLARGDGPFPDRNWLREKLERSIALRRRLAGSDTTGQRLIFAESDGLPGIIVDRYDQVLVVQIQALAGEYFRSELLELLPELTGATGIYDRSDSDVRKLEGLEERTGLLYGSVTEQVKYLENGLQMVAHPITGQKTGDYLDQRDHRMRLRRYLHGELLNVFSYHGSFTLHGAISGVTRAINVDASAPAHQVAQQLMVDNGLEKFPVEYVTEDAFALLRKYRDKGLSFDSIILDPPRFAPTINSAKSAARGYKDINLLAMKLLKPGGILATFSCSGGISGDLFQKILYGAAVDSGREVKILEHLHQGPDHPVPLTFPEAAYLKGMVLTVD